MRKTKRFAAMFLAAAICLGIAGCGSPEGETQGSADNKGEREVESWPKTGEFLDGEKYEFDENNWACYEIEEIEQEEVAQVSIYCAQDAYPLGEECFLLLIPELEKNFDSFSVSCWGGDDEILYEVLLGNIVSNGYPEIQEGDVDAECREKAIQFCNTCVGYLTGNATGGYEKEAILPIPFEVDGKVVLLSNIYIEESKTEHGYDGWIAFEFDCNELNEDEKYWFEKEYAISVNDYSFIDKEEKYIELNELSEMESRIQENGKKYIFYIIRERKKPMAEAMVYFNLDVWKGYPSEEKAEIKCRASEFDISEEFSKDVKNARNEVVEIRRALQ